MYVEIPSLTRCCFCVPLRLGLLIWACLKVLTNIAILGMTVLYAILYIAFVPDDVAMTSLLVVTIFVLVLDVFFNFVLIVRGHIKSISFLHHYYRYGSAFAAVFVALSLIWAVNYINEMWHPLDDLRTWCDIAVILSAVCSYLILHIYLLLLVRSEIIKLKSSGQFMFVNFTADPQCFYKPSFTADPMTMTNNVTSILVFGMTVLWIIIWIILLRYEVLMLVLVIATMLCLVVDICFNFILIVGSHKKNASLLRLYYRYGFAHAVVFLTLGVLWLAFGIASIGKPYGDTSSVRYIAAMASAVIGPLILHLYLFIVLRSEINKLKAKDQLRFVNHTAELPVQADYEVEINKIKYDQ